MDLSPKEKSSLTHRIKASFRVFWLLCVCVCVFGPTMIDRVMCETYVAGRKVNFLSFDRHLTIGSFVHFPLSLPNSPYMFRFTENKWTFSKCVHIWSPFNVECERIDHQDSQFSSSATTIGRIGTTDCGEQFRWCTNDGIGSRSPSIRWRRKSSRKRFRSESTNEWSTYESVNVWTTSGGTDLKSRFTIGGTGFGLPIGRNATSRFAKFSPSTTNDW